LRINDLQGFTVEVGTGSEPEKKDAKPEAAAPPPPPGSGIKIPIRRFKKGSSCS